MADPTPAPSPSPSSAADAALGGIKDLPDTPVSGAQAQAGLGTAAEQNQLKVWASIGAAPPALGGGSAPVAISEGSASAKEVTFAEATADIYSWSPKKRNDWVAKLRDLGLIAADDTDPWGTAVKAWQSSVTDAANFYSYGKQKITPLDALDMRAEMAGLTPGSGGAKAGAPTSSTSTNTSVDLLNPTSAKDFLTKALAQGTGREPTDDLVNDFLATVQRAQKASPNVNSQSTSTTGTGTGATSSTSSSTSSGGVDVGQLATDYANKQPDHDNYALETSFFQALTGAVQSPV